jgi:Fe-S-cluster containining protein
LVTWGRGVMGIGHHLDVDRAVGNFLKYFESLSYLPLIADAEMDGLFGAEVKELLAELERYNGQERICRDCVNRCCQLVDCELYSPELSRCPIHSFRPPLCRMHFCNKFVAQYGALVKEAGDVFLESLLAAEKVNGEKARLFDSPPLGGLIPRLVAFASPLITAIRENGVDEAAAWGMIRAEIEKR